jgi:MFS superfamily sulfate permease-like transporter
MKKYFTNLAKDMPSAIVVFLVALPLCLGIAQASNPQGVTNVVPLLGGIMAGIVGGIVIGLASGSQLSVSGPAAGLTSVVAASLVTLGKLPNAYEAFLLSLVLAGGIQLIMGFVKAGVIGDYVPNSVIKGMLAAIGLILIWKQLPHLVGYDADPEGDESFEQSNNENTFTAVLHAFRSILPGAALIGLVSLAILICWEALLVKKISWLQYLPGPLVVVVVGTLISEGFKGNTHYALEPKHLVNLPASQEALFRSFRFPDFSVVANISIWLVALKLALVASLETLLGIEAVDKLDPLKRVTPANRELKAQGLGNIASGLIGGLPLTSVIVRSSANVNSGAQTKVSSILHGVLLLLSVLLIPFIINKIPLSALAAVLIFTGYKLARVTLFKEFYQKGWDQFIPFVVTIIAILRTDLLVGIVIGLLVGLFFMVRSNFRSAVFIVNDQDHYLIRLRKDVSFLNKPIVKRKLEEVPANAYVIIDATRADFIDKDVIEEINNFLCHAHLKNIRVEVKKSNHKEMHNLLETAPVTG